MVACHEPDVWTNQSSVAPVGFCGFVSQPAYQSPCLDSPKVHVLQGVEPMKIIHSPALLAIACIVAMQTDAQSAQTDSPGAIGAAGRLRRFFVRRKGQARWAD